MNLEEKYREELLQLDKEAFIAGKGSPKLKFIEKRRKYVKQKLIAVINPIKLYNYDFFAGRTQKFHKIELNMGKDLAKRLQLTSVVDFGCGLGSYLMGLLLGGATRVKGYEFGYEAAKQFIHAEILPYIEYGDVTLPINCGKFDCSLSIEVAEHIHPDKSDQFIDNLVNATNKWIVFTAAPPGQEGVGHINCQPKEFWINKLKAKGFSYLPLETKDLMKYWEYTNAPSWLIKNGMVFNNV